MEVKCVDSKKGIYEIVLDTHEESEIQHTAGTLATVDALKIVLEECVR